MKLDKDYEDESTWQWGGPNYMACWRADSVFLKYVCTKNPAVVIHQDLVGGMFHADTAMREKGNRKRLTSTLRAESSAETASRRQ